MWKVWSLKEWSSWSVPSCDPEPHLLFKSVKNPRGKIIREGFVLFQILHVIISAICHLSKLAPAYFLFQPLVIMLSKIFTILLLAKFFSSPINSSCFQSRQNITSSNWLLFAQWRGWKFTLLNGNGTNKVKWLLCLRRRQCISSKMLFQAAHTDFEWYLFRVSKIRALNLLTLLCLPPKGCIFIDTPFVPVAEKYIPGWANKSSARQGFDGCSQSSGIVNPQRCAFSSVTEVRFFSLLQTAERKRSDKTRWYQSPIAEAGLHLDHSRGISERHWGLWMHCSACNQGG